MHTIAVRPSRRTARAARTAAAVLRAAVLIALLSQCSRLKLPGIHGRGASGARGPATEAAVYAVALDALFAEPGDGRADGGARREKTVVIADRTTDLSGAGAHPADWLRQPSSLWMTTFADFRAKNRGTQPLQARPRIEGRAAYVSDEERRRLVGGGDRVWRDFFAKYRNAPGLVELSRVGFSPDSAQAFLFVRRTCGAACGEGTAVLAARLRTGEWQVRERHVLGRRMEAIAGEVSSPRSRTAAPSKRPATGKPKTRPKP